MRLLGFKWKDSDTLFYLRNTAFDLSKAIFYQGADSFLGLFILFVTVHGVELKMRIRSTACYYQCVLEEVLLMNMGLRSMKGYSYQLSYVVFFTFTY